MDNLSTANPKADLGSHSSQEGLNRVAHESAFRDRLNSTRSMRPLELVPERGVVLLQSEAERPLSEMIDGPMPVEQFLRLAVAICEAVAGMHASGLIHKDLKPSNVFVDRITNEIKLTGFGIASRVPRLRQSAAPPEVIAGTFAYMAPEQTGRMNRSIDSRSDLYALGVTYYEMLTGVLPFVGSDHMEWIHCHIARQPIPPAGRDGRIPAAISSVVMKLLAKAPEHRYQTAAGLQADLECCLAQWIAAERIDSFGLGEHDASEELLFREKLYGREEDLVTLHHALERVVKDGACELVLVSGYSGVGKSSFVNELHAALVPVRSLFAGGKFDQYKRGIPYSTLAQAFQRLVRDLLCKSDTDLLYWRNALVEALGANGQLMVDLVPELALIIGEQPPVGDLSGSEAQSRFLLTLRQFLNVFARAEHPLVLFLDDLHWLDHATLDVLEDLCLHSQLEHLLLVGAYRDNEVGSEHPLMRRLELIRKSVPRIHEIVLTGIGQQDVACMIADAIGDTPARVRPLAKVVFEKTAGNPFFTIQFVNAIADEGLLERESLTSEWRWDTARISAKKVGDNVVELMMERLSRLPTASRSVLQRLACLGHAAQVEKLGAVIGTSEQRLRSALHEPLRSGLLLQIDDTYAFAHDRVHEAAYAMISESERAHLHRTIGARLLETLNEVELENRVFDVVSQFNRAKLDDSDSSMRVTAASLNLRAARKAKASAAYRAACGYLEEAGAQLGETGTLAHYQLSFDIALLHAECMFLLGNFDEVEKRVSPLLSLARTNIDMASVYRLKIELHVVRSENDAAIAASLIALRLFGIDLSPHPSWHEVQHEYDRVWSTLSGRSPEVFADLPVMRDPEMQAAMKILAEAWPPAFFTDFNLTALVICHMVNVSLVHGTTSASNQGYALFGWILGPAFGRYQEGYRIAKLAFDVAAKRNSLIDKARTCDTLGLTSSWTQPLSASIDWSRLAYRTGVEAGDLYFACYSAAHACVHLIMRGQHLDQAAEECEEYLAFAGRIGFRDGADLLATSERTIASLRGLTRSLASFDDGTFDEAAFEAGLTGARMNVVAFWYWTRKTMLKFLAGDIEGALAASEKVQPGPWIRVIQVQHLDYHFYTALALAAHVDRASEAERSRLLERLREHDEQLKEWAQGTASATFADKKVLVAAELARLEGDELAAQRLYEEAICLANRGGFLQTEGIACELAARFHSQRGFERIARCYVRDARGCFARWGASAKVRQLDLIYPHLGARDAELSATSTVTAAVEQLDLSTVLRVSQAVSSDMVLDKLIDTLMRTVMEHAGAERAALILMEDGEFRVVADATTNFDVVSVCASKASTTTRVPASIVNYVARTRENVILDDARTDALFATDEYVRERQARSVLCLPLANRTKLIGMLYLENNLAPRVFTAARITILKLVASQAAISLENTRLYAELEEREARIRRLVDSNIIGIFMWDLNGQIIDANDAFLRILGFSREDVTAGRLRWTDLTPPEGKRVDDEALALVKTTGSAKPWEKEYFREDGTRVPVLIGAAAFDAPSHQGVSFVIDLTEQKRAEKRVRESEQRYRELQSELAHANRVATMGQLSAWIAHDVRQPLVSVVNSAEAGLRWLSADPPDVGAALRSLGRVVRDGHRAAQVLDRTRSLVKKALPRKEAVDLNLIISETIALVGPEAERNGILVQLKLDERVPPVHADRVQIQQVVLNLIVNAMESMAVGARNGRHLSVSSDIDASSGGSLVSVQDSGPGVSPDVRERLFDAFYSTKPGGLGMGLAICRTIVESYGGRIWVASNSPRGAVFHMLLPAAPC